VPGILQIDKGLVCIGSSPFILFILLDVIPVLLYNKTERTKNTKCNALTLQVSERKFTIVNESLSEKSKERFNGCSPLEIVGRM
jgi:hypothetical protein